MGSDTIEIIPVADNMELAGKIALITGAGRGIGKALAVGFAKAGAQLVLVSRTLTEIEAAGREAEAFGNRSLVVRADVAQPDDVRRMADAVASRFGRLDVLINNAALRMNQLGDKSSYYISFENLTLEDWDSTINVNLRGPFLCIKECLPLLQRSSAGNIINISAGAGKKGMSGRVPYCASKFGLEALTQCLALEFESYNIAVNSLSPGKYSILTDSEKFIQLKKDPDLIYLRPEVMVPPALFLARQTARGLTGQHIEATEWVAQNNRGAIEDWRVRI